MSKECKASQYLSKVLYSYDAMELQIEKLETLRARAEGIRSCFDSSNHSHKSSSYKDSKAEIVASIVDLETKIKDQFQTSLDEYDLIQDQINSLPDERYKAILQYRFLLGKSYQEIADKLGYEIRNIYKIMNQALDCFEKAYLCEA